MTSPEAVRFRQRASLVLSALTLVIVSVAIALQLFRNSDLSDATDANRAVICAAARLIALNPVRQLPGEAVDHYQKRLVAANIFLRLASHIDCTAALATYGIRLIGPATAPGGGDPQSPPQTGSQLPGGSRPPTDPGIRQARIRQARQAHPRRHPRQHLTGPVRFA